MKNLIAICFFSIAFVFDIYSQNNCEDFEKFSTPLGGASSIPGTGWIIYNWNGANAATSPPKIKIMQGVGSGNTTKYITASDVQGSTHLINNSDYNGDWTKKSNCFCFDVKLISDGDPGNLGTFKHGINIYKNLSPSAPWDPNNPGIRFQFVMNTGYDETTPWRHICLPIQLLPPNSTGTVPLPSNGDGYWVASNNINPYTAATVNDAWNDIITHVTAVGFFVDVTNGNQEETIGLDNICFGCPEPSNRTCCPELKNLVANFDFSNNTPPLPFYSQYTQASTAAASVQPGQYAIVNQAQAATISPTWLAQDHGTCPTIPSLGNFLIVNGQTGQTPGGWVTIWEQTIAVTPNKEYRFCAYMKNLPACGFDVIPEILVDVNHSLSYKPTFISTTSGSCDWQLVSFNFVPNIASATITIKLLDTRTGDGNDLAIDDIACYELPTTKSQANSHFAVGLPTLHPWGAPYYQIPFTSPQLTAGCYCNWQVCELDPVTNQCKTNLNDPLWWALPTYCTAFNFPGYDGIATVATSINSNFPNIPGAFDITKTYRITRASWCDCEGWASTSYDLLVRNKVLIVRDSETKKIIQQLPIKNK